MGCCAVSVDVADVGSVKTCVGKRKLHAGNRASAFGMGSCNVVSVAGVSAAFELRQNLCAARQCVFFCFKHKSAAAFAYYKSVAGYVKRSACGFGIVVSS